MARKKRADEMVPLTLRLPEGLRAQIAAEADKAERSLNAEILWRLGQTLGEEWRRFIAGVEEKEKRSEEIVERIGQSPLFKEFIKDELARQEAAAKPKANGDA
jgi:hypothetical protein